ncbi:MAG: YihA family ribosome biogenesis GTP-binding protein [Saprospiraceae bacterium]|nr:YihA family ribosome biogenesis GTP-binding protein [Saprospiraceae bacterium]
MEVEFVGAFPVYSKIPEGNLPEIAFWGRSNVGKSSLINLICQRKNLAKVSGIPGKTQSFVQYKVNDQWMLMDLPGYGYARVGKKLKAHWTYEIPKYLKNRHNLCLLNVLIDSSIEPQEIDLETMRYLGQLGVPFYIIMTKSDRCTKQKLKQFQNDLNKAMYNDWESLPPQFFVSAQTGNGRSELLDAYQQILIQIKTN